MSHVTLPPDLPLLSDGAKVGGWWHETEDGRIFCDLCPRECHLKEGDRGFCFVRENRGGQMVLTTYGRSTGFCIDPIEKKPLNHFLPGTSVLSFGTAGCNLGCKFCQNWDISKSREIARLSEQATPEAIATAAAELGCRSVACTYNDPVIWAEYAIDTAKACRERGICSVAVTAGYITPVARAPFYEFMDAANVDLKAFTEEFYYRLTYSHIQPVLETLKWLKHETDVWFEITNLIIPDANDSTDEFRQLCDWVLDNVGDEVPVHFTAFHPDFRMMDRPRTPPETLVRAREIACRQGIKFAYVGNVHDVDNQSTYCPQCGGLLIERDWYELGRYQLDGDKCGHCGAAISGRFERQPGDWGRQRMPVQISRFAETTNSTVPQLISIENPMSTPSAAKTSDLPKLSADQERQLHQGACELMAATIAGRSAQLPDETIGGLADHQVMGVFVTAKRRGRLRGCCGTLGRRMPLYEALKQAAARTAADDPRLPPIALAELPYLDIDVTLLGNFQTVEATGRGRIKAVEVGRHGLQIQRGNASGLLLPSVAVEHDLDAEGFLRQVCMKAKLPTTAWEDDDSRLTTFEGVAVHGPFATSVAEQCEPASPPFSQQELTAIAEQCRYNVLAVAEGATPNYYLPGCSDGNVVGAVLVCDWPGTDRPVSTAHLSFRPGVPLQSTLFKLVESATAELKSRRLTSEQWNELQVAVTVLERTCMHGTVAEPDLRGLDANSRALCVVESGRSAIVFDPDASADELLELAGREVQLTVPAAAQVYSFDCFGTAARFHHSSVPRAARILGPRQAAQAGRFYPDKPVVLQRMVDQFLNEAEGVAEDWPAVMVPHAGLVYSGRIAAATLKRVRIPDTVVIIGPKHTRLGVEWAVSPHRSWLIPGAEFESDVALAEELAEAIPDLQLDAAAHQQEHAIEVELPVLARLAPQCKVVGIAMGQADLDRCRQFADGLVKVLSRRKTAPLLVISSDMNHFATDAENRRLDEIALQAMETLDSARLLSTVRSHNISMCGVLPAVTVMQTLEKMGKLKRTERVAYGTSADVSGDAGRVVGYAGMLLG